MSFFFSSKILLGNFIFYSQSLILKYNWDKLLYNFSPIVSIFLYINIFQINQNFFFGSFCFFFFLLLLFGSFLWNAHTHIIYIYIYNGIKLNLHVTISNLSVIKTHVDIKIQNTTYIIRTQTFSNLLIYKWLFQHEYDTFELRG